ncbi:MAG TPA: hypothetical protein VIJ14_03850 [Rhabdochlamydiaceae bacterium]
MRIYNVDSDQKVNKIVLYLTPDEAQEMKDSLELIINSNEKHHHEHVSDRESGYKREVTVCIYKEDNLSTFDERSRKLILSDD